MKPELKPGAVLPDFELPDHTGTPRKLSFLQGDFSMILTLGRGIYCPKDRMQLLQLVEFSKQCDVAFTRIVTITPTDYMLSNDLRLGVGAHWPFLHDQERTVGKALDLMEYTDTHNNPFIPTTFVLEPGLNIYKIYNGYWYWGRPSVAELHQDLREITRKNHFDWNLGDPAVRAAWEKGEKEKFYPYGKTMQQVFTRMAGEVDD